MEKDNILKNVHRIPANTLYKYISEGIVTFEELQATGKFIVGKQNEVRKLMAADAAAHEEEDEAWQVAQAQNSVAGFQHYLGLFPSGRYADQAHAGIQARQGAEVAAKQAAIDDLLRDRMAVDDLKLRKILGLDQDNNRIGPALLTEDDLANHGVIPRHALNLVLSPPPINNNVYGWADIPPLNNESTDIYIFGVVGSGKSCMLAGLLAYMDSTGSSEIHIENRKGFRYAQDLINAVRIGFAPISTPVEGVNYISLDLIGEGGRSHPLNIIEMSGEFFNETYESGTASGAGTIGASDFLANNNQKIIFLAIDYYKSEALNASAYRENQAGKLNMALQLLAENGTLDKVDGVYLILTKSDLLSGGAMDLQGMDDFVNKHYMSLRTNLRRKKERYGFDTRMFPFSLGDFYQADTFQYRPETSAAIIEQLKLSTFTEEAPRRSGSWWNR